MVKLMFQIDAGRAFKGKNLMLPGNMNKLLLAIAAVSSFSLTAALPSKAQEADSFCYLQTASGRTIDLAGLCKGQQVAVDFAAAPESSSDRYVQVGTTENGATLLDKKSIRGKSFKLIVGNRGRLLTEMQVAMSCSEKTARVTKMTTYDAVTGIDLGSSKMKKPVNYEPGSPIGNAVAISCKQVGAVGY